MLRLLIDITHTASHNNNTGIQRVARCLAQQATAYSKQGGVQCFPVMHHDGQFVHIDEACAARGYRQATLKLPLPQASLVPSWMKTSQRIYLNQLGTRLRKALYPRTIDRKIRRTIQSFQPPYVPVNPTAGDVILMADAWWDSPEIFQSVERAQQDGALVGSMVHDIIAIRHPEFFTDSVRNNFVSWAKQLVHSIDFLLTDAVAVEEDLWAFSQEVDSPLERSQVQHVRLGCDLETPSNASDTTAPKYLQRIFADRDKAPYLMVGTLEIRKNHHHLLDAFDRMWQQGQDVSLAIVGKIGWKCDDLVKRIAQHPQADKRLHYLSNIDDNSLNYIYQNSKALVFPSKSEGFGLPIVEAANHGLHVFASDIPVFHEVAGPDGKFFGLDDPGELCQCIEQFEAEQGWQTPPAMQTANEPWSTVFSKLVDTVEQIARTSPRERQRATRKAA